MVGVGEMDGEGGDGEFPGAGNRTTSKGKIMSWEYEPSILPMLTHRCNIIPKTGTTNSGDPVYGSAINDLKCRSVAYLKDLVQVNGDIVHVTTLIFLTPTYTDEIQERSQIEHFGATLEVVKSAQIRRASGRLHHTELICR